MPVCMEKLNFKRFNKKFLCAVIILICTVISGVFNPVYRIFAVDPFTNELEPTLEMFETCLHILMGFCSFNFSIPACKAIKYSYKDCDDERFRSYMKTIIEIAIAWAVLGSFAGIFVVVITFFLIVDFAMMASFSIYMLCLVNAMLALKALKILKKQN